jgi:hypothetical protein
VTLSELERWLARQIAGVYHLSIHSALGKTPLAAWQSNAETTTPPRDPLDETEFFSASFQLSLEKAVADLSIPPNEAKSSPRPQRGCYSFQKCSFVSLSLSLS